MEIQQREIEGQINRKLFKKIGEGRIKVSAPVTLLRSQIGGERGKHGSQNSATKVGGALGEHLCFYTFAGSTLKLIYGMSSLRLPNVLRLCLFANWDPFWS